MLALRSALFLLFQAVTVVPYGILCLLMAPLPLHVRYRVTTGWPRIVLWAARVICGIRWQVKGWENLPNGPAVLLSKHQSTWETFFYISYMPKELCFVFKRELLWVPFFGWGIGLLKMIHIDRSQGRDAFESVVQQGQRKLDEGRWIIMFPEGTRIPRGRRGKYKSGGSRLAIRTAAPVIPMAVNSAACWPKRPWIKRPGLITVSIGPPIASDGLSPDQLSTEVEHWIEAEMRRIDPDAYHHTTA
ncbi:MAG: lysophospholipid acyltransferase family protein [Burkholderiales bacterium]|nr:lysophospholipid acyltransferase family protein [Burkholderiales bacterium]